MILPPLQGTCNQQSFYIYAACDVNYFDEFGHEFISSIKRNTTAGIHIHLFNPRQEQIEYCHAQNVSVTWEDAPLSLFEQAVNTQLESTQLNRTLNAMGKGKDNSIFERMQKTYYACTRFVRLQEVFTGTIPVLELDIDAVVRRPLVDLLNDCDFYVHRITGKRARFLAGGLWLIPNSRSSEFLKEYSEQLQSYIARDYIYWGLDQDLLDPIVPKYNYKHLPITYIDWNMHPDSIVWTAKGARKDLEKFVNEKQLYKS